jgi:outer membrane protein OmpA-like peptidoglycan-associated protein
MKWVLACCLFVARFCLAQNLVPNPGFEEFSKCPITFSTDPKHFGPNDWNSPSQGTPDYYNKCAVGDMDVPRNWAGVSFAHSGVGYAGIYAWSTAKHNYREYVQCKLKAPLKPGVFYNLQFYFRLSSYSVYAIDRIGLALLESEVKVDHDSLLQINPILTKINNIETLTNEWYQASAKFQAKGGEQFLLIGNFSSNNVTESKKIEYREGKSLMLGSSAYYYIDDVSVSPVEIPVVDSLSATSIATIKPNEAYVLNHINFQFNSFQLLPSSFDQLDFLVSVLKKNPQWKIQLNGHTDDQGSDDYNLTLSANRATSVGDYIAQHGVSSERIQTRGFGKQKPLLIGNDEQTRAINRRVEVKFLDH